MQSERMAERAPAGISTLSPNRMKCSVVDQCREIEKLVERLSENMELA